MTEKTKSGKIRKNCYNCKHIEQAEVGDYGSGGEMYCEKIEYNEDNMESDKYLYKSKVCCELKQGRKI